MGERVATHPRWGEYLDFCKRRQFLPSATGFMTWLQKVTRIILPGEEE